MLNAWVTDQIYAAAGAIIFVYKLLIMNDYTGLREGLHGGSELVQLNRLVTVSTLNMPSLHHGMTASHLNSQHSLCTASLLASLLYYQHSMSIMLDSM